MPWYRDTLLLEIFSIMPIVCLGVTKGENVSEFNLEQINFLSLELPNSTSALLSLQICSKMLTKYLLSSFAMEASWPTTSFSVTISLIRTRGLLVPLNDFSAFNSLGF